MSRQDFKILIVCTGNTCRSPMAEGILKSTMKNRGIENIKVGSAGIGALEGMPATPFAIEAAKLWDVDISHHRARQLNRAMLQEAGLILAMAPEHSESIIRKAPEAAAKTYLIKGFPEPLSKSQEGVQDPIGGTIDDYNQTYMELDEILRRIENKIITLSDSLKNKS